MPARPDPKLAADITDLRDAKNAKKDIEDRISIAQGKVLTALDESERKSVTVSTGGVEITATAVHSAQEVVNEAALRKALGATMYDKMTKKVLDNDKLEHALASGLIDANVVAQCSETVERKPYVTIKERGTTARAKSHVRSEPVPAHVKERKPATRSAKVRAAAKKSAPKVVK